MSKYPEIADKLMSLQEAVGRFVTNGCQLSIGGFTVTRNPMAAVYEIVRQRIRDIHLVCHSNGQGLDVLIGAGCVRRVEIAYGGNGRYAPTCFRFRKAVEKGWIEFEDYSNYQMSLRFLAGSLSIPFIATKSGLGSDLLRRPWVFRGHQEDRTRWRERNSRSSRILLLKKRTRWCSCLLSRRMWRSSTLSTLEKTAR